MKTGHTKAKKTRGKVLLLFGVTAECFEGIEKKDNFISLSSHCIPFCFHSLSHSFQMDAHYLPRTRACFFCGIVDIYSIKKP